MGVYLTKKNSTTNKVEKFKVSSNAISGSAVKDTLSTTTYNLGGG